MWHHIDSYWSYCANKRCDRVPRYKICNGTNYSHSYWMYHFCSCILGMLWCCKRELLHGYNCKYILNVKILYSFFRRNLLLKKLVFKSGVLQEIKCRISRKFLCSLNSSSKINCFKNGQQFS